MWARLREHFSEDEILDAALAQLAFIRTRIAAKTTFEAPDKSDAQNKTAR